MSIELGPFLCWYKSCRTNLTYRSITNCTVALYPIERQKKRDNAGRVTNFLKGVHKFPKCDWNLLIHFIPFKKMFGGKSHKYIPLKLQTRCLEYLGKRKYKTHVRTFTKVELCFVLVLFVCTNHSHLSLVVVYSPVDCFDALNCRIFTYAWCAFLEVLSHGVFGFIFVTVVTTMEYYPPNYVLMLRCSTLYCY